MNKKYMTFGLISLFAMALVSAGLISYYGQVSTTINVNQPISFLVGSQVQDINTPVVDVVSCDANKVCLSDNTYKITNGADYPIDVKLITTGNTGAIDTKYVGKLLLENKDSLWNQILGDSIKADLVYTVVGDEFGYNLNAEGLAFNTPYSLIYYADKPDRFDVWGGNNPGALIIDGVSSDALGNLVTEGSIDLVMNLPSPNDANIDEYSYCTNTKNDITTPKETGDNFPHCHGAKIWLVPTLALPSTGYPSSDEWACWSASGILFETDLIWYSDSVDTLTVPANSFIEFTPEYTVGNAEGGEYTITTTVDLA